MEQRAAQKNGFRRPPESCRGVAFLETFHIFRWIRNNEANARCSDDHTKKNLDEKKENLHEVHRDCLHEVPMHDRGQGDVS